MTDHQAPTGADLTAREREVLSMVAAGMTNREIGEALFISESTAGVHVSNTMAKLGVGSRTEAAAWATRAAMVTAVPAPGNRWLPRLQAAWHDQLRRHPRRVATIGGGSVLLLLAIAVGLAVAVLNSGRPTAEASARPSASGSLSATASAGPSTSPTAASTASGSPTGSPTTEASASPSPTAMPSRLPIAIATPTPTPTSTPKPTPAPTPSGGSGGVPAFDHIFLVVDENRAYSQIIGSGSAPYLNSLAQQYGLATNYHAIRHPSLPNYLALIGGDTFGVTSNCPAVSTGACTIDAANLADRIEAGGRDWGAYFESMPTPCDTSVSANHDPFIHFDDIRTDAVRCARHLLPYASLSADLATAATTPDLVFISANDSHNMHTGSIAAGDSWLKNNLAAVFDSPAWTAGKSLLLITWDEDDGSEGNRVVTILVGPSVRSGLESSTAYTHYSLLRTIEESWGLAPLTANDSNAAPMSEFFR